MKTDRSVIVNNNQEFGQLADPNKLEAQIEHVYDVVDSNDDEFITHKGKVVDKTSSDMTQDKHVSNNDIKGIWDSIATKTDKTGNHAGTWQGFNPADFDGGTQAIQLQEHIDGSDPALKHTASVINVADVDGHFTATDLEGVLGELFTFADDGKTSIATVVGSPATVDDTFGQLETHIQNSKNTLATNLTDKGQSSVGTETLQALVDKVALVNTGKKWASGTTTSGTTSGSFEYLDGTSASTSLRIVSVNNLDFLPSVIYLFVDNGTYTYTTIYSSLSNDEYPKPVKVTNGYPNSSITSAAVYHIKGDVGTASVTDTGFTLPVTGSSLTYTWVAYE